ncbi:heavy metal-binding domain-containing protein [Sinorhizobium meliloti]|uniref:UPF0145 protein GHK53_24040 n=2 Tax=Rhizobium meliloti TaxID=382 RepID=A0AAW9TTC5_RHIML|nr:heavy metal-binding domain-containing protein [Sinorhizobium meliloti]
MPHCRSCQTRVTTLEIEYVNDIGYCRHCAEDERKYVTRFGKSVTPIIMVTTPTVAGREATEPLGIVSSQVAFGMNVFRDIFAGVRDIVGGRSDAQQKVFADSRKAAFDELMIEAGRLGADAIVGVDLDFTELSGGGKGGMVLVVATGTAVKLVAVPEAA